MVGGREPTGEEERLGVGQRGDRAKQGVAGGRQARGGHVARRGDLGQPIALTLEGVGGERGQGAGGVLSQGGPGYGVALNVQVAEGAVEGVHATLFSLQGAGDDALGFGAGRGEGHAEDGVGADLQEYPVTRFEELVEGLVEAHGLSQIATPVGRVEGFTGEDLALYGGVKRQRAGPGLDGLEGGLQVGYDLIHVGGVGGVVDVDPAAKDRGVFKVGHKGVNGVGVAGHHRGSGGVDHGNGEGVLPGGEVLGDLGHGEFHHGHPASTGETSHEVAAGHHHLSGVFEGERASDDRGGHLALAVADNGGGF